MKPKLFIHMGFPRTGTSFLQEQIFRKIPNVNFQRRNIIEQEIKPDRINIFGDESLTGAKEQQRITIANRIHKVFPDAYIIIGIRNQPGWYRSLYNLRISKGYIGTLDDVIKEDLFKHSIEYIEHIRSLFKHVFVYKQEDMVTDFQSWLNHLSIFMQLDLGFVHNIRINPSWSNYSIQLAERVNPLFRSSSNPSGLLPNITRTILFRGINSFIKYKRRILK